MKLKSTLEQWLTLIEVDKAGSIQAASHRLNKSHTTLIYAIKKLEAQLGVSLIRIEGRKAVLTDNAKTLLRRAVPMVDQARELEVIGAQLSQGMESEIIVSIDHLCCRRWLYQPLQEFFANNSGTSVKIRETSLSSTQDAVKDQLADIAIVNLPVENYLAEAFGVVTMIPVVSRNHPLAQKDTICNDDLLTETQIVVRDLGSEESLEEQNVGWLKSQRRVTVDNFDHAWQAVSSGLGFCRMPDHRLEELDTSELVRLPLQGGTRYQVPVHLVAPKVGRTGLAAKLLYDILLADAGKRLAAT
ncbi:LysR family transcriptional regulator [Photobacterium sagamiensis]|uniref:LysR family transcriptional regulator n=1 Tax=Photobacterium sagamiensis TaxID=2910241 RepID=UPI003D0E3C1E